LVTGHPPTAKSEEAAVERVRRRTGKITGMRFWFYRAIVFLLLFLLLGAVVSRGTVAPRFWVTITILLGMAIAVIPILARYFATQGKNLPVDQLPRPLEQQQAPPTTRLPQENQMEPPSSVTEHTTELMEPLPPSVNARKED
jgi:hypothetical protein